MYQVILNTGEVVDAPPIGLPDKLLVFAEICSEYAGNTGLSEQELRKIFTESGHVSECEWEAVDIYGELMDRVWCDEPDKLCSPSQWLELAEKINRRWVLDNTQKELEL